MARWLVIKLKNIYPAPYYLLFKSYLSDRSFKVKIKTTLSRSQTISAGVLQDSDIAPFFYTIITVDIPISTSLSEPMLTTPPNSFPVTTLSKQISNCQTTWITYPTGSSHGKLNSKALKQPMSYSYSTRVYHPPKVQQ